MSSGSCPLARKLRKEARMKATSLTKGSDEALDQGPAPHLSHSRVNRYLTCPEQYRLYYVAKLRPRIDSAGLVFGVAIHAAIADLFRTGEDPVEHFVRDWQNLKDVQLHYKKRESWEDFNAKGAKLLTK